MLWSDIAQLLTNFPSTSFWSSPSPCPDYNNAHVHVKVIFLKARKCPVIDGSPKIMLQAVIAPDHFTAISCHMDDKDYIRMTLVLFDVNKLDRKSVV